jgi:SpoVK/Ycf46/Vps4 family AAA+-type ATPase
VDLPTKAERKEILAIHLEKKKRNPANFNLDQVVQVTHEFSGAELEQLVKAAMYLAFAKRQELTTEDLVIAAQKTIPLAQTMREPIQEIRRFCSTRAVRASDPEVEEIPGSEVEIPMQAEEECILPPFIGE